MRTISRAGAVVSCLLLLATCNVACDPDLQSDGPVANCEESGVQCQLAKGPLGVCERAQCGPDETPPCFQCTPQH